MKNYQQPCVRMCRSLNSNLTLKEEIGDIDEALADKVVVVEASENQGSLFITEVDNEICDDGN